MNTLSGAVMNQSQDVLKFPPEEYRDFLMMLARIWLPRKVRRKFDASDFVQATLVKAIAKQDQVRGNTNGEFKAWLRTTLRNVMRDKLDELRLPEESRRDFNQSSRWPVEPTGDDPSVGTQLANQETFEILAEALAKLSDDAQEVVVLKYFKGWKRSQIAEYLGRTQPSVAGLLQRALEKLHADPRLRKCFEMD